MGGDFSELLCHGLFETVADELAGEGFRQSVLGCVQFDRRWFFMNDRFVTVTFTAQKYTWDENGEPVVMYNPCIMFTRPRTETEWWPDMEEVLAEELEDEAEDEDGPVLIDDEGNEEYPDDDELPDEEGYCYVTEVWDYYLDDKEYRPRMNIRSEYYYKGSFIHVASVENPKTPDQMLSEVMDEDIDLQVKDGALSRIFSELDVAMIEAICSQDYQTIKIALERMGCFDEAVE